MIFIFLVTHNIELDMKFLAVANFVMLYVYFSIFSTVSLPAVSIFDMITRIRIRQMVN